MLEHSFSRENIFLILKSHNDIRCVVTHDRRIGSWIPAFSLVAATSDEAMVSGQSVRKSEEKVPIQMLAGDMLSS
jgi:hypothetical protein